MDDQNKIDCDPQKYRAEWFEIAACSPVGREFELPDLSDTPPHSPLTEAQSINTTIIEANLDQETLLISPKTLNPENFSPLQNDEITKQEVEEPKSEPHEHENYNIHLRHLGDLKMSETRVEDEDDDSDKDEHKCCMCNVKFPTGNALGGHMSSHAKKRKLEVMRNGGLSVFKADRPLISGLHGEPSRVKYFK